MRGFNKYILLVAFAGLVAWWRAVHSWHRSRNWIVENSEDLENGVLPQSRYTTTDGGASAASIHRDAGPGLGGNLARPAMLEAGPISGAEQAQKPMPPPQSHMITEPPDPQSQLEQHILDEHALEENHKNEGGEHTLEEKLSHAHKQAAVALRQPNMKPNIRQVLPTKKQGNKPGPPEQRKHVEQNNKKHEAAEHDKRHGARHHGHNWAGYKGPLVESKQAETNSNFYTKYVHNTIEKKMAYPILKGFWNGVLEYYPNANNWFDGGAGTCGVMEAALKAGKQIHGVELSDVSQTTCKDLYKQGLVTSGPLDNIPHPDNSFDLVFSSEVLEHVPPNLAEKSVRELVRIAQRDVFTTISLRPSALDRPGKPPKVHLCVRPRPWWEDLFEKAGCVRNEDAYKKFQQYDKKGKPISPHFFIYICEKAPKQVSDDQPQ